MATYVSDATTSIFRGNNLFTACTDELKFASTNPGSLIMGGGAAMAAARITAGNPYIAAAQVLGGDALGICAYGAINAAADNFVSNMDVSNVKVEPIHVDTDLTGNTPSIVE